MTQSHHLEDLAVGMSETMTKRVTEADIVMFADATGDRNPVHLDEAFAEKTVFKQRIAHGLLTAGFISAVLGTRLPGPGCVYVSQSLRFKAPVKIGDEVSATVTITELQPERRRVLLDTVCRVDGKVVLEGEAVLMVPERAEKVQAAE